MKIKIIKNLKNEILNLQFTLLQEEGGDLIGRNT